MNQLLNQQSESMAYQMDYADSIAGKVVVFNRIWLEVDQLIGLPIKQAAVWHFDIIGVGHRLRSQGRLEK